MFCFGQEPARRKDLRKDASSLSPTFTSPAWYIYLATHLRTLHDEYHLLTRAVLLRSPLVLFGLFQRASLRKSLLSATSDSVCPFPSPRDSIQSPIYRILSPFHAESSPQFIYPSAIPHDSIHIPPRHASPLLSTTHNATDVLPMPPSHPQEATLAVTHRAVPNVSRR
jgi:hypothetical protein